VSFPRYPTYKASGVEWLGDVPGHWEMTKLKYACRLTSGGTPSKATQSYWDGEIPWASSKDLKCEVLSDTIDHISELAVADGAVLVEPNDLLIVVRGMILAHSFPVAKVATRMSINQDIKALRVAPGWSHDYFAALLRAATPETFRRLDEAGHGTKALRMEAWTGLATPRPPLPEQHAIAAFLDRETARIDALVAEQERLIELLREKRQAVISHAVTKGLEPNVPMKDSGVEWLGAVPAHWEVKRLKHVSPELTVGIVVEPSKYYVDAGVPALRSLNIASGRLKLDSLVFIDAQANDLHSKSRLKAGDLVAVRSGQPGATAVIPPELDGCNCIDLIIIRRPEQASGLYLCWYLGADAAVYQFTSGSGGAIQQHFNVGTAANLVVCLPPPHEQHAIADFLDSATTRLDALTTEAERAIALLQERRAALISAAVTGQIDVRGLAPEVTA
jgi:type I restriction enzyme S subunit